MSETLCGDKEEHEYWTEVHNVTCPICKSIKLQKLQFEQREKEIELLAEKIANKIIEKLGS